MSAVQLPRRGDHFERWLKDRRDTARQQSRERYEAYDQLLDDYRLHADTGTPLTRHACEAPPATGCEAPPATGCDCIENGEPR